MAIRKRSRHWLALHFRPQGRLSEPEQTSNRKTAASFPCETDSLRGAVSPTVSANVPTAVAVANGKPRLSAGSAPL
ncbi:hypothetical protein [Rhodopila sp.]|uniref:hypothetical protein n=1 Tax=Rhodopila sp. TaxID=2480087 RepID=UPI003D10B3E7